MEKRKVEEQLEGIEKRLANAEKYVARKVNVESSSWLHFDDWRGESGHPAWMTNFMIPTLKKQRARKEKALETLANKARDRNLTRRKQQEST